MLWVLGLVLKAWQFRVISPRRRICKNSLTKRNFKAGSWISKQDFAQKRRISRSYCSGSRDRSNRLAEGPRQSKINYGRWFLWLWRIWFDDGGRNETVLRYCFFIYEITERRAVTRQKGRKPRTPRGRLKNVFSGRQLGLVQEETLVVFYTRMPRETATRTWDEVEIRKKFSPLASILFSTESEETDWREKLEQSKGQSCY